MFRKVNTVHTAWKYFQYKCELASKESGLVAYFEYANNKKPTQRKLAILAQEAGRKDDSQD